MATRLGIFVLWALHLLPLPMLALCGNALGVLLYVLGRERRRVARTNLRLCFPEWPAGRREWVLFQHFCWVARSILERSLAWWASPARLRRLIRITGEEHIKAAQGRPIIFLAPHFVMLDMGWTRLTLDYPMVSLYSTQKNKTFNHALLQARQRFGDAILASRQQGLRPVLKAMKEGRHFYYLPDLDYGPKEALFVPFFGVPAATITGLPRLAAMTQAVVVPCMVRARPWGLGYEVQIGAPWADYPSSDVAADVRRMNACIEDEALRMPAQYYWVHKRFKTRPDGEAYPYE